MEITARLGIFLGGLLLIAVVARMRCGLRRKFGAPCRDILASGTCLAVALLLLCLGLHSSKAQKPLLLFALDCSQSMQAPGVASSRLSEGKRSIKDLSEQFPQANLALFSFAGSVFMDCPPIAPGVTFRQALDETAPGELYEPGSFPELVFGKVERLGQGNAVAILVSDCEMQSSPFTKAIWGKRRVPLLVINCGVPGRQDKIPHNGGHMTKPGSAEEARSTSCPSGLFEVCALSTAPFALLQAGENGLDGKELASAKQFISRHIGKGSASKFPMLALAMLCMLAAAWASPLLKLMMRHCLVLVLLLPLLASADDYKQAAMLCNQAARLCQEAMQSQERSGELAEQAVKCCQEALQLSPGLEEAAANLELALKLRGQVEEGTAKGKVKGERQKGSEQAKSPKVPQGQTQGEGNTEDDGKSEPASFGSWREIKEKQARRNLKMRKPTVLPW